jgi:hypothetical protein
MDLHAGAVRGALAIHRALLWLSRAALPAELRMADDVLGAARTHMLGEAARLGIADRLEHGPQTSEELARQLDVHPDRLHRLLRALACHGVFRLERDGRFANNRLSRVLGAGHSSRLKAFADYFASGSNAQAWSALGQVLRDGDSGFQHAHGRSVWDWLGEREGEGRTFHEAMQGLSERSASVIAAKYPWQEASVVCDVGGGVGTVLAALLTEHPHLSGILADRPEALGHARHGLAQRGLSERVCLQPTDFFAGAPPGADVYLLKNVLHDWDDERCLSILDTCRSCARQGARVLIAEQFLEPDACAPIQTLSDVQMMVVSGQGRERSQREYVALARRAGLRPRRVFRHPLVDLLETRVS